MQHLEGSGTAVVYVGKHGSYRLRKGRLGNTLQHIG
jgi:hypothetical protein